MSAGYNIKRVFEPKTFKITVNIVIIMLISLLIVVGSYSVYRFFFPKKSGNINRPTTIVLPGARIGRVDNTSTQIQVNDKGWQTDILVGGVSFDNKTGGFIGLKVGKKW